MLQNLTLRHIYIKKVSVFQQFRQRLPLKVCKNLLQTLKANMIQTNFSFRNSIFLLKNAKFDADIGSVEKAAKKITQKKLSPKSNKNLIFDYYYCVKSFLALTFLSDCFCTSFNGFDLSIFANLTFSTYNNLMNRQMLISP